VLETHAQFSTDYCSSLDLKFFIGKKNSLALPGLYLDSSENCLEFEESQILEIVVIHVIIR
jgi:hypothetical protein